MCGNIWHIKMFPSVIVRHGLRIYKGSEIKLNLNPGSLLTSWATLNKLVNLSEPPGEINGSEWHNLYSQ